MQKVIKNREIDYNKEEVKIVKKINMKGREKMRTNLQIELKIKRNYEHVSRHKECQLEVDLENKVDRYYAHQLIQETYDDILGCDKPETEDQLMLIQQLISEKNKIELVRLCYVELGDYTLFITEK